MKLQFDFGCQYCLINTFCRFKRLFKFHDEKKIINRTIGSVFTISILLYKTISVIVEFRSSFFFFFNFTITVGTYINCDLRALLHKNTQYRAPNSQQCRHSLHDTINIT